MDRKAEPKASASEQIDRFKEAARQLDCDEDEAAFDEKLKAIAKQKPRGDDASATKESKV